MILKYQIYSFRHSKSVLHSSYVLRPVQEEPPGPLWTSCDSVFLMGEDFMGQVLVSADLAFQSQFLYLQTSDLTI